MPVKVDELLVKTGSITEKQLKKAVEFQSSNGGDLNDILIQLGYIKNKNVIAEVYLKQLAIGAIKLADIDISPEILEMVAENIAKSNKVLPIRTIGRTLFIAVVDWSNMAIIDKLKFVTGYEIQPIVVPEADLKEALDKYYGEEEEDIQSISDIMEDMGEEIEILDEDDASEVALAELEQAVREKPIVRLVDGMIMNAIKMGASDIHIEPFEKLVRLRYRIDGILREMSPIPNKLKPAVVSRLKIMSKLDISERRRPQDGRIKIVAKGRNIDLRVSILPVAFGEKVVMRILDPKSLMVDITKLGFPDHAMKKFTQAIHLPFGMVLVTGPTGSGKTTTLYSALSILNKPDVNIMTAEDPVEFNINGINQVNVKSDIGLTFAAALRSFLRQDPNIVLVGEIRDLETADTAVKAALTGHLVFSTLHTNDAPSTITRLIDMGIAPFLAASAVKLVMAQRLLRKICPFCKEEYQPPSEELELLGISEEDAKQITFYKGKGCNECGGTGNKGRTALFEVMPISHPLQRMITEGATALEIQEQAIKEGMLTLRHEGIDRIKQGIVSVEQVIAETMA